MAESPVDSEIFLSSLREEQEEQEGVDDEAVSDYESLFEVSRAEAEDRTPPSSFGSEMLLGRSDNGAHGSGSRSWKGKGKEENSTESTAEEVMPSSSMRLESGEPKTANGANGAGPATGKGKGREDRDSHQSISFQSVSEDRPSSSDLAPQTPTSPTFTPTSTSSSQVSLAALSAHDTHPPTTSPTVTFSPTSARRPRMFSFATRSRSSSTSSVAPPSEPTVLSRTSSSSNLSRSRPLSFIGRSASTASMAGAASEDGAGEADEPGAGEAKGWKGKSKAKIAKVLARRPNGRGRRATLQLTTSPSVSSLSSLSSVASLDPVEPNNDATRSQSPSRGRSNSAPLLHNPSPLSRAPYTPSSPSPFTSALPSPISVYGELVPAKAGILLDPQEFKLNLFDFLLPREVRLRVMELLIGSCREDWEKSVAKGEWKGEVARQRWIGEAMGRRELIKVGRVSRTWLSLSLDGSLWPSIPLSLLGGDAFSTQGLLRLVRSTSSFVRHLDLRGMASLTGDTLSIMAVELSGATSGKTLLTTLNLAGCRSIDSTSLDNIIGRSPFLTSVNLAGIPAATDSTICALGESCSDLLQLDVSRCPCVSSGSFIFLPRGLKVLKAAKPRFMANPVLVLLGRHFDLETLDVSFCGEISDSALESIVRCGHGDRESGKVVKVKSDWKRVLSWKHVNFSGCRRITDLGLGNLAGSVPELETLELAQLGPSLHTGVGLAKLFWTTPRLKKLDLEDAVLVDDQVLVPLTPTPSSKALLGPSLEHLILSNCITLTNLGLRRLFENSTSLTFLELDGTVVTESTAKMFVTSLSNRMASVPIDKRDASQQDVTPHVLSLLDARSIGRSLNKDLVALTSRKVRYRSGQRGHWTVPIDYDDDDSTSFECDPTLIVVRSFYSSLFVDANNLQRQKKRALRRPSVIGPGTVGDTSAYGLAVRRRALSDLGRRSDDVASSSCVLS